MANTKKYDYDWFKIILCAAALSILMILMFNAYTGDIADLVKELSADGKSPNRVWLVKNLSAIVPVFILAGVLSIFYYGKDKYVPIYWQKEKMIVFSLVAAFTFVGILGYVLLNSGEKFDPDTGVRINTLWDKSAIWFFAQIVPFVVVISYHAIRAESEEKAILDGAEDA